MKPVKIYLLVLLSILSLMLFGCNENDIPTALVDEIIDVLDSFDTYVIYNQDGRADLVKLYPKTFNQPYTVETTLLKDIMVFTNDDSEYCYMVTRDGKFWTFSRILGKLESNTLKNPLISSSELELEYRDLYCDQLEEVILNNPPDYPTSILEKGGFNIKITKNTYIGKYNIDCNSDVRDTMIFYEHNIHYFKADYPMVYVIYDNGIQQYYDVRNNGIGGRSDTEMDEKYREKFSNSEDFIDVTNLEYKMIKTDNYGHW